MGAQSMPMDGRSRTSPESEIDSCARICRYVRTYSSVSSDITISDEGKGTNNLATRNGIAGREGDDAATCFFSRPA